MLRIILLAVALLNDLAAVEPPSIEALQSEIAQLKADLKAAQITRNADMAACWSTDLNAVQARFQAAIAQKEAADLRNAPKPEALTWTGGPQEWTARRGRQIIAMVVQSVDGPALYDQRGCPTPEKPCELAGLVKSLDEAKARAAKW